MEKELKNLLYQHKVTLKKAYGQNFLTDEFLLDEIVEKAGVTEKDVVLEIGCGAGALTRALAKKAKKVIGYEIDNTLRPVLEQTLSGLKNVNIVFKDVMKEKLEDLENRLGEDYIMVANLPYYITTPIVMEFIEKAKRLRGMAIMVQEEVAERFSAKAGSSDYGAITVAINLRGSASVIIRVPREKFTPIPNVDSAVVKIDIDKNKNTDVDFDKVRNVVRCAFSSRRKMLVNNIMNVFKLNRQDAENILINADVSLTARGEQLDENAFIRLAKEIYKNG